MGQGIAPTINPVGQRNAMHRRKATYLERQQSPQKPQSAGRAALAAAPCARHHLQLSPSRFPLASEKGSASFHPGA